MPVTIVYDTDLIRKLAALAAMRVTVFDGARGSAMSSAGWFMMEEVRDWIEKEGKGTWPPLSPVTRMWDSKWNAKSWHRRSGKHPGAYNWLGKFARYKMSRAAKRAEIGFGKFKAKDVRRGKQARFDRRIQKIAHNAQKKRIVNADDRLRRKFGAQRESPTDEPGVDFFPLARRFGTYEIPARPIMEPVFMREERAAGIAFQRKYFQAIVKRFERL